MNIIRNLLLFLPKLLLKLLLYIFYAVLALVGLILKLVGLLTGIISRILSGVAVIAATGYLVLCVYGTFKGGEITLHDNWYIAALIYLAAGIILIIPVLASGASDAIGISADIIKDYAGFPMFSSGEAFSYEDYSDENEEADEDEYDDDDEYEDDNDEYDDEEEDSDEDNDEDDSDDAFYNRCRDHSRDDSEVHYYPPKPQFDPFAGVTSSEELKKRYFALAKCYHPDSSGGNTTEQMEYINSEYQRLMQIFRDNET